MKVFVDYHHGDLYHSLHLLFEKRLGWELYRPIGKDWHTRGFWRYSDNPATINQYLGMHQASKEIDGVHYCTDINHATVHKAITPEKFMSMDIDMIIASVVNHERAFYEMSKHKPNCKFIRHEGNNIAVIDWSIVKNLIASTSPITTPTGVNAVFYHQEFETTIYSFIQKINSNQITNLMNCLPHSPDYPVWGQYKELLPEFDFKMYGILGTDGIISGIRNIAHEIQSSKFIWHLKSQGDGFGHTIHNAYACGRPCIVKKGYYAGRLAEPLLINGVTCIDLDQDTVKGNVDRIRYFSRPDVHEEMCIQCHELFKEVVNFDAEFEEIKKFLERLI